MYVCLCRGITDRQIKNAIDNGAKNLGQLRQQLGVAAQCGKCACMAKDLLSATKASEESLNEMPLFYSAVSC